MRVVVGLMRGTSGYDGPVDEYASVRYEVVDAGVHRYDAIVVGGWQPLVVFAPGTTDVLAWWSDQDDRSDGFADADAVYAAYEAAISVR